MCIQSYVWVSVSLYTEDGGGGALGAGVVLIESDAGESEE